MRRPRRKEHEIAGSREARSLAGTLGDDARATRHRRRLTQQRVSDRVGISRARLAELERGEGDNAPLATWVKLGIALARPLAVAFSRDIDADSAANAPRDAGHLAAQELVLRLARGHGRRASVELATRPHDPAHAADVVLRDERARTLILVEILNRAGDLGAAARSTDRKAAELERFAILEGGDEGPFHVASGWLLVDSAANRRLVARYPEFLRTRLPGSSVAWARALAYGAALPPGAAPALAWVDTRAGRIHPLRWRA
jgi:transcriptional regulator with XRE-family HTH domain